VRRGDFVGIDEVQQRELARREALDEGCLSCAVWTCDDVEGRHAVTKFGAS
jgi:hypothetical protein